MAAIINISLRRSFLSFTRSFGSKYLNGTRLCVRNNTSFLKNTLTSFARALTLSAVGISVDTTFEPNDPRLKTHECLKNAAGMAVDSTSAVLSQTVYAIIKAEEQYREMVKVLVLLMEYQIQVLGHTAEEERIEALIVETRHEMQKLHQRKLDLHLLFSSVEKLADATAEVAFATGCEYASTSAGERLHSAQKEVERLRSLSEEVERQVQETTVKSINAITKYDEDRKKREEDGKKKDREDQSQRDQNETLKTKTEDDDNLDSVTKNKTEEELHFSDNNNNNVQS